MHALVQQSIVTTTSAHEQRQAVAKTHNSLLKDARNTGKILEELQTRR
eukprot:COSAG05_NODE_20315_length_280_cov_0.994475_1_plen_47_part_10